MSELYFSPGPQYCLGVNCLALRHMFYLFGMHMSCSKKHQYDPEYVVLGYEVNYEKRTFLWCFKQICYELRQNDFDLEAKENEQARKMVIYKLHNDVISTVKQLKQPIWKIKSHFVSLKIDDGSILVVHKKFIDIQKYLRINFPILMSDNKHEYSLSSFLSENVENDQRVRDLVFEDYSDTEYTWDDPETEYFIKTQIDAYYHKIACFYGRNCQEIPSWSDLNIFDFMFDFIKKKVFERIRRFMLLNNWKIYHSSYHRICATYNEDKAIVFKSSECRKRNGHIIVFYQRPLFPDEKYMIEIRNLNNLTEVTKFPTEMGELCSFV